MEMPYYQKIRNIREDNDIKQYELANYLNIKFKTYNLYENGLREFPLEVISKILMRFNISFDYILGLSDIKTYGNLGEIDMERLRSNFRKYRKDFNLSQSDIAFIIKVNQQTLSDYERGKSKIPIIAIKRFCKYINISADTICGRCDNVIKLKNDEKIKA